MRELICKHQDIMLDTVSGITVSSCRCLESPRWCGGISKLVCDACKCREEPDEKDQKVFESLNDVFGPSKLETRALAKRVKILETHCFKCEHCDPESRICGICNSGVQVPVDEHAKYAAFHCALEKW